MEVLETNANSEVFELEGTVIDEPVEIQSIKVYVPNDEEGRTTTVMVMHYLIQKLNVLHQQISLLQ